MSSWAGALCYFSKILPKIDVIFELRVIEQVNGPLLFLAESLSLCQPLGRLGALLVAELDECLLHHLPHGHVPCLLIHEVGI
jgi:hypothetical protein